MRDGVRVVPYADTVSYTHVYYNVCMFYYTYAIYTCNIRLAQNGQGSSPVTGLTLHLFNQTAHTCGSIPRHTLASHFCLLQSATPRLLQGFTMPSKAQGCIYKTYIETYGRQKWILHTK